MKFTAFALAALPVVFAIPEGFITQCCYGGSLDSAAVDAHIDASELNIAGKDSALCLDNECLDGFTQIGGSTDFEEALDIICRDQIPNSKLCPDGLNCCQIDENGDYVPDLDGTPVNNIGDAPWTCGTLIGAPNTGVAAGIAGATGYYCGPLRECKLVGAVCGDPHIQTWDGGWYDFHGACDLVFVKDEEFAKGLGLAIHLRTTARYEYSYVETAALKIGDDILEVSAYGEYFLNGVQHAALEGFEMGGLYKVEYESADKKTHTFNIIISQKEKTEKIQIKTFKDLVSVKFDNAYEDSFGSSVGLMGNYNTGSKLARDGKTVIEDAIEFGMEWQVRAEEPMLFQATRAPQLSAGEQCVMPTKSAAVERRRLGETVPLEAAVAACEAVDHIHHENCVYDVVATGDLEIAHAGVF